MQQVRHGADQFDYTPVQVKSNLLMEKNEEARIQTEISMKSLLSVEPF